MRAVGRDGWLALCFLALGTLLGAVVAVVVIVNTTCGLPS